MTTNAAAILLGVGEAREPFRRPSANDCVRRGVRKVSETGPRARANQRRRLVAASVGCVLFTLGLFVLAVKWPSGSRLDAAALHGHKLVNTSLKRAVSSCLANSLWFLFPAAVLVVGSTVLRREYRQAVAAFGAMVGAVVVNEAVSRLLSSSSVVGPDPRGASAPFPSGHAAAGMAVALGLIIAVPRRRRGVAALAGVAVWAFLGVSVVISGWHRPSESLAAFAVALLGGCLAVAAATRDTWQTPDPEQANGFRAWTPMVAVGMVVTLPALVLIGGSAVSPEPVDELRVHIASDVLIFGSGFIAVGTFLWLIRDIDLSSRQLDTEYVVEADAGSTHEPERTRIDEVVDDGHY